jgi:hypothetical protein
MRPEVRIVQQQSEEIKPAQISRSEEEALLAKYGFNKPTNNYPTNPTKPQNNLTFEEMCRLQDEELRRQKEKRNKQMYGPKPTTFTSDEYYSEEKWGSDDGLNFKVTVVSNMKF